MATTPAPEPNSILSIVQAINNKCDTQAKTTAALTQSQTDLSAQIDTLKKQMDTLESLCLNIQIKIG